MYVSILSVLLGGAVRMQDARYVADDVSKLFLWTATLSQQESVEIGEGGGVRREEEQQEQEGTLEGLFLWVTVLLVLSPLVPLIENQTEKKNLSLFTPGLSNFSFLLHLPLFHSGFYRTPLPFFSITGFVMRLSWKLAFWFLNISPVLQLNRHTMTAHIFASLPKFKILNVTKQ